jgi:hypothetical protein
MAGQEVLTVRPGYLSQWKIKIQASTPELTEQETRT